MEQKHNFNVLAEAQKYGQKTLYCGGLDPHPFGDSKMMTAEGIYTANMSVYGFENDGKINDNDPAFGFYAKLAVMACAEDAAIIKLAGLLSAMERYIFKVMDILAYKCNIRVTKPQAAFYEQFGPLGNYLLQRVRNHLFEIEKKADIKTICILDCKRGDIDTTQACYFRGLMGNLLSAWGISYTPFDFDIINVTPWMGKDVLVLEDKKGNPLYGLELVRKGKGIIVVDKSSNPSGPDYQDLYIRDEDLTFCQKAAQDCYKLSQKFDLEFDGLSPFGLVVGSTHRCDGSLRRVFPTYTGLNPGFGAQEGEFMNVMLELIRTASKWNGMGAIFTSSRGTLYPWNKKYGGSGKVQNLEQDLVAAVTRHREQERDAYQNEPVKQAGIVYPF